MFEARPERSLQPLDFHFQEVALRGRVTRSKAQR